MKVQKKGKGYMTLALVVGFAVWIIFFMLFFKEPVERITTFEHFAISLILSAMLGVGAGYIIWLTPWEEYEDED